MIHNINNPSEIPSDPRVGDEYVQANATRADGFATKALLVASPKAFGRQVSVMLFPNGTLRSRIVPMTKDGKVGKPIGGMTTQMRALEVGQSFSEPVSNRVMQSLRNHVSRESRKSGKRFSLRASRDGLTVTIFRL